MQMFNATYVDNLPAMERKQQWDVVYLGFKLCAPVQNRPRGRPRKTMIRAKSEGKGLGGRRKKCSRCGRLGHHGTHCKESIGPTFGEEDEHWGVDNAPEAPERNEPTEPETIEHTKPKTEEPKVAETEKPTSVEIDAPAAAETEATSAYLAPQTDDIAPLSDAPHVASAAKGAVSPRKN
ncbi:hypothetical protein D1007_42471 [Hordeum vulgare]|nr:hypothetical protein D1007_42471 [Hordeum vulgare]